MLSGWSTDSVEFVFFTALISTIGGLLIHIHGRMEKKVDNLAERMDESSKANAEDHAKVVATLSRVEEAVRSLSRDIDRHDRDIEDLRSRDES